MTGNQITETVLVLTGVAWLLWETVIVVERTKGFNWRTISMVFQSWGWDANSLPFLWGVLGGHYWINRSTAHDIVGEPWIYIGLAAWFVGMIVRDVVHHFRPSTLTWRRFPGLWLGAGVLAGAVLWPQRSPLGGL